MILTIHLLIVFGVSHVLLKTIMSDVPGAVKNLKDEITCPVCQEFFQDPKILPNFHYYCKRCVLQLAAREQPFPCPECRGDTLLPPTGADGFPTAFFVNRFKSLHDGMKKVQEAISRGDLMCELCHSDKAMTFCAIARSTSAISVERVIAG